MLSKDKFIDQLTEDLEPVRPLAPPWRRWLYWGIFSFLSVLVIMLWLQPFRAGFESQLGLNLFTFEVLLSFLPWLTSGFVVFVLSVPGLPMSKGRAFLAGLPFVFFVASLVYGHLVEPSLAPSMAGKRPWCFYEVLLLSWIPIGIMVMFIRSGYAATSFTLLANVALASVSIPVGLMQIACMYIPEHNLLHHVGPAVLVFLSVVLCGKFFLRPKY